MKAWNFHVYPQGGWYFEIDGIRLTSGSYEELITNVERYHAQWGRRVNRESIAQLIVDQLCARSSSGCVDASKVPVPVSPDTYQRCAMEVHRVQKVVKQGDFEPVAAELAQSRASTCAGCRFSTGYGGSCLGCGEELQRVVDSIGRGFKGFDTKLRACSFYKQPAGLLGITSLPPDDQAPDGCWRKSTS